MIHAPAPGAEGLAEPLRSRWSPSIFDDTHELSDEQVDALLTAAQWAPSSGNRQPWALIVLARGGPGHDVLVGALSRGNSGWVPRASAVVLMAAQVAPDPDDPDGRPGPGELPAAYDLGQAAAHLTLQAQAMGLATHQLAGFDKDVVATGLGVPAHLRLMAGIAVGVRGDPAEVPERDRDREQRVRERRPLAAISRRGPWTGPTG